MTGRARGRARGRENNTQNTRRPGEPVPVSYGNQEVDRAVGYGRNAIGSSHNPQGLTDEFPSLSLGNTRNQAENSGINTHVSGNDIVSGNNTGTWQGLPANGVTAAQRNEVGRGRAGNTNGGVQGNQVGLAVGGRAGNTNGGVQGSEVGLAVRGRAGNTNGGVQGSEVGLAVGGRAGNTNGGVQGSEVGLAVGGRAGNTNGGVQGSELGLAVGVRAGNTNGGVQGSEVGLAVGGRAGNTNGGVQGSEVGLAVGGRAGNTNGGVQGSEVGLAVGGRAGNTNGGVQGSGVGLSVGVRAAESRTSSSGNGYSGGSGGPGMQSGHPGNARSRPIEQRSFPGRTNDEERSAAGQGAVQQLVTQSAQASLPPGFGLRKGFNTVGGVGQQIQLATNHFALTMRGDQDCLYQYSLEFSPDLEHKAKRMQAIRSIENTIGEVWLYDKGQMMFLPVQLPDEITCCQGSIRRRDTPEGVPVQVTITYRCDVLANSPSFGQVLNTIMARIQQTLGMKRIGDRYFYTEDPFVIPQHRIEILPGFRTSIQHHDNGYLLGLDVAHKYLRSETVVEFLHNLSQRMPNHDSYTDEATRQLCGEIVLTRYNNKTYKILEIDWDKNPLSTFTLRDGSEITFVDYYTRQYDRVLEVLDQPLLLAKPKGRTRPGQVTQVYLLPELCFMTGLSADMRSDFNLMRSISDYTRVAPKDRATELTRFMGDVNTNPEISGILGGLNIQIDQNLTHFSGRVLNPESIIQGRQTYRVNPTEGDWSREIRSSQMHTAMPLQNWAIVVTLRDSDAATDFLQTMLRVGPPMGVPVNQPHVERLQNDQINSYLMALRGLIREENPSMVVVIVPTNRKDRYDAIKKLCCIEMPVPSQVIVKRTLGRRNMLMSVCTKICIQGVMVVGIDVFHDKRSGGQSVGAMVGTMNSSFTKYESRVMFQQPGQELSDSLNYAMTAMLRAYHRHNGRLPVKVKVYRDGVGEGQIEAVIQHEIQQFLQAFRSINTGTLYNPELAVTIVQKRILPRFYAVRPGRGGRDYSNPPPGTLVDTVVTRPHCFDFFLVSQSVRQGTVTPSHYTVIYNTISGWQAKIFQLLSYKLTHLYFNWPGTIRVPAPCQYAHKLAYLVGESLHREPSIQLSDKLYFL